MLKNVRFLAHIRYFYLTKLNISYIILLRFLTKVQMTVTTESGGRQNAFPNETRPYIDETASYEGYPQNAEKVNGRWAMIGMVALLGAYLSLIHI